VKKMMSKTIIITGGTGIIGQEIVKAFSKEGFTLVIVSKNKGRQGKLMEASSDCHYICCDVTKPSEIAIAFKHIIKKFSPFYGLINCVGVNTLKKFEEYSYKDIEHILNVNLVSTILIIKEIIPIFMKQSFGKILNISSQAGIIPQKYNIIYSAAKAGVIALTKGLAIEYAPYNISVNSICPGDIESSMMQDAVQELAKIKFISEQIIRKDIIDAIPSGRMGNPVEVAEAAKEIFLIKTQYLTGANITIAGGRTCN
jgi:NAD(P)-dependent dehydrogenase (short-subunit alcohol dehydrogenase family)